MKKEFATFDRSEFPLVKVVFNLKDPTLSEFNQLIEAGKNLLADKKPYVIMMDARLLGFLSSEIRIAQGRFFKEYAQDLSKYCLGAVIWVSSPIVKMMLKGMMLIAQPPNITLIASSESEARKLAEGILGKRPLEVSSTNEV